MQRALEADATVVTVQAGAGYGKTTLLGQVVVADPRPSGWLSLDAADDDPVVLLRHVVAALHDAGVGVDQVEQALMGRDPDAHLKVLPLLARALDETGSPFLVVLDDLHVLSNAESIRFVEELVAMVPRGSRLVLAGRVVPDLPLVRWELAGDLLRIGQTDLEYSPDEARRLLAAALPDLSARLESDVVRVSEGWPAVLHLAILAMREHPDPPVLVEGLLTSNHRVVDYLQREVLARLEPDLRRFLLDISILDPLSGPVCDAVTERTDSDQLLEELIASGNLFVSPVTAGRCGEETVGYRLHRIFAELLMAELRSVAAERERSLRLRAVTWYEQHGRVESALRQAIAVGDERRGAQIVFGHFARVLQRGEPVTLERWLRSFPGDVLGSDGLLSLAAGWLAVVGGDPNALAHHLGVARANPIDGVLPDGTATHEVAIAMLEAIAGIGGVSGTARSAALVVAAGPTGSPWWQLARQLEAVALVAAGRAEADLVFTSVELDTRGVHSVHSAAVSHLALARLRSGDLTAADRLASGAVAEAAESGMGAFPLIGIVHCVASLAAAAVGDLGRSRRHAADAACFVTLTECLNTRAGAQSRQLLAEAALMRGELQEAGQLIRSARMALSSEPDALDLLRGQDELEQRCHDARLSPEAEPLTSAELRVLQQLPTHRSLEEIGQHLYVSRNTVKSHVKSIYRKLGVSGRSEAVERATQQALIDGGGQSGVANRGRVPISGEHGHLRDVEAERESERA